MGITKNQPVALQGIDCPLNAPPSTYQRIVKHIKSDPLTRGALITSHKLNLYQSTTNLFDQTDHYAQRLHEVSCISKTNDGLIAQALDVETAGLSLNRFLPPNHWQSTSAHVLLIGAGGSSAAISTHLLTEPNPPHQPHTIHITDITPARLNHLKHIHTQLPPTNTQIKYHHTTSISQTDQLLQQLPPHSLIINATGLGKDRPGSPITNHAQFPPSAFAWELNYRGELRFKQQAERQANSQNLTIIDGWDYFILGWTRIISEVFHHPHDNSPQSLQQLSEIATRVR